MIEDKTTESLNKILRQTKPDRISDYLEKNADTLVNENKPFRAYMLGILRKKGYKQQELFIAADISEKYGYRIISEEKHTKQRDTVLRLCYAGRFSLLEAQRALKIYGMPALYAKIPRDAVLIIAFNNGIYDISSVNSLLLENKMDPLRPCGETE